MFSYLHWRIQAWLSSLDDIYIPPSVRLQKERTADMVRTASWVGVFMVLAACFLYAREMVRERFASRAEGVIVSFKPFNDKLVVPVFEYKLPDGKVFTSSVTFFSNQLDYKVGDKVGVLY